MEHGAAYFLKGAEEDTSGLGGNGDLLRAAGLSDLSPCVTAAQWFEPHLRRRWKQAGWPYIRPLDSMPGSLRSSGESISAIFSPPGVKGSNPRSPCRHHPRRCNAVQPLRGLRGVQHHLSCNASRPGKKLLRLREWCAQPLSNFTITEPWRSTWVADEHKLVERREIIFL